MASMSTKNKESGSHQKAETQNEISQNGISQNGNNHNRFSQKGTSPLDLKAILQQVADKENLTNTELILKSSSEKGDGYIGVINFCQIKGTTTGGKPIVLDLVVKSAPKSEKFREGVPVRSAFLSECYNYGAIHPKFRHLQNQYNITEPFDSLAKSFLISEEEGHELIVLPNLKTLGYSLWDRRMTMNEEHVIFVMKEYGKLHALSYALRHIDGEAFLKLVGNLKHNAMNEFYIKSESALMRAIDKVVKDLDEKVDSLLIERILKFKSSSMSFLLEETVKTDEYSVIIHGDCWTNNFMFRYDDQSEPLSPSSMYFLDWQCSRLCSPAVEVAHFFLCNSPKEIIDNTDKYLRIYYESLSGHLNKFGVDPNVSLPYSKFMEEWKRYSRYGLLLAYFVVKIQVGETDEIPDLAAIAESGGNALDHFFFDTARDDVYYERIKNIASYLVDNDLL